MSEATIVNTGWNILASSYLEMDAGSNLISAFSFSFRVRRRGQWSYHEGQEEQPEARNDFSWK